MKITVEFTQEEQIENFIFENVTDLALIFRCFRPVQDKEKVYHIRETYVRTVDGGQFREVVKEIRQWLEENGGRTPNHQLRLAQH